MSNYTAALIQQRKAMDEQIHQLQTSLRQENMKTQAEQRERFQTRHMCLQILTRPSPDDMYLPVNFIKSILATFFIADQNVDGKLTLQEVLAAHQANDEQKKEIERYFNQYDFVRDQKLSLAEHFIGQLGVEMNAGYPHGKKVKAE